MATSASHEEDGETCDGEVMTDACWQGRDLHTEENQRSSRQPVKARGTTSKEETVMQGRMKTLGEGEIIRLGLV